MPHAIRIHELGGPETLQWETTAADEPGTGEVRIRHSAIGLNYIDVYFRTGLYKGPDLPFVPGVEAAGVVDAIGPGVDDLHEGDRVAYALGPPGAYCEYRVVPAERLVALPDDVDERTAAAMMLKGMTAQYLLRQTHPIAPGDTILFHAAAGGVGLIACQWARALGARVIGTVGSTEKAELALPTPRRISSPGCANDGAGVPVVYDSVGEATFMRSLDCLAPLGHMVSFGQSSGAVAPLDIAELSRRGSLTLTRPTLATYTATPEALRRTAQELFEVVGDGRVRIEIGQTFPLAEAADAHRALESRATTGSTLLLP